MVYAPIKTMVGDASYSKQTFYTYSQHIVLIPLTTFTWELHLVKNQISFTRVYVSNKPDIFKYLRKWLTNLVHVATLSTCPDSEYLIRLSMSTSEIIHFHKSLDR